MADQRPTESNDPRYRRTSATKRLLSPEFRTWSAVAVVATVALVASLVWRPRPLLLWNASGSSPVGLYLVTASTEPRAGDIVIAWAPARARRLAAARGYLPSDVPLVKRVAAVAGDRVCATGGRILINGRTATFRRTRDPSKRPMPRWSGCLRLRPHQFFLLSPVGPDAFDGRYFGVTRPAEVVGTARLLWAKPVEGSAHG
jgi:conjugative transfer signal peptidase TraF